MNNFTLSTPVVMLVFNRPKETERVFAAIREARPQHLLIVADGPRASSLDDGPRCEQVRRLVEQVDWPCEVLQNYSDVNLGCRRRVSTGLDWVFKHVEEAIILEDDCLPDPAFFRFCQEMLKRYRHDYRIGMISGDNFQFGHLYNEDSYYFSRYFHIWGWASWRDRWVMNYDVTMKKWVDVRNEDWLENIIGTKRETAFWQDAFERVFRGDIDTWDYQWVFTNWIHDRMSILPAVNMVSNIGFNNSATHTRENCRLADLKRKAIDFPLRHPQRVYRNINADKYSGDTLFRMSTVKYILKKVSNWLGNKA